MADLASLQVNINASQAVSAAQQVVQALTSMGAAGDAASTKAADAGDKFQSMFDRIRSASSGTGTAGLANLTAEASRAQDAFEKLQAFAIEMAGMGDAESAGMARIADKSAVAAAAIQETVSAMGTMISEGANVNEVIAMMSERLAQVGASANFSGVLQANFAGLREEFASVADQSTSIAERAKIATQAITDFGVKGREAALGTENALKQVGVAEDLLATKARTATMTLGGATSFLTNITMGTQMLTSGGVVGSMIGVQQLTDAMRQGAAAGAPFIGMLAALVPAFATVAAAAIAAKAAFDILKEGMAAAAADESFEIRLKSVMGTMTATKAVMETIDTAATTGVASFIPIDQLRQGVLILEQFTHGALTTESSLKAMAGAAAQSGTGFTTVAEQIGRVYAALETGAPLRMGLLTSLVQETVLSEDDAVKIKSLANVHASAAESVKVLTQAIKDGNVSADQAKGGWSGLITQLQNIMEVDLSKPFGTALESAMKGPLKDLSTWLSGQKGAIQDFANNLSDTLMGTINFVKVNGFQALFNEVAGAMWNAALKTMETAWQSEWAQFGTDAARWGDSLKQGLTAGMDALKTGWNDVENAAKPVMDTVGKEFLQTLGVLQTQAFWDDVVKQFVVAIVAATDKIQAAFANALSAPKAPGYLDMQRPDTGRVGGVGGLSPEQQKLLDDQNKIIEQQKAATQQQSDASKVGQDSAVQMDQTIKHDEQIINNFGAFVQQFGQAIGGFLQGMGGAVGGQVGLKQVPPFPGDVRTESEWKPGEPQAHSVMFGATGLPMGPNTLAMSPDLMTSMFGSEMGAIGKFVNILDQAGNMILNHQQIRDVSYKSPGVPNQNTIELWGRPDMGWSKVQSDAFANQQSGQYGSLQDSINQQKALRESQQGAPDTTPKGGTGGFDQITKATKANADAMKSLDEIIKQVTNSESAYGKAAKLIDEQEKAGQISLAAGEQQKISLLKSEISTLEQQRTQLAAVATAQKTADNSALIEKAQQALDKLDAEVKQYQEDLSKLQPGTYWQSFTNGINQAITAWGGLSNEMQTAGKQMTDQIESGLVSGIVNLTSSTKGAKQAFEDMAKSILTAIEQIIVKLLVMQLIEQAQKLLGSIGGGSYSTGATAGEFALGGLVRYMQPGGPIGTDTVPAYLTPGEFVLDEHTAKYWGTPFLQQLQRAAAFAQGGLVKYYQSGGSTAVPNQVMSGTSQAFSEGVGGGHTFNTNVTIPGGGMNKDDAKQLQEAIHQAIKWEIVKAKKPGGVLNKNYGGG